MEMDLTPTWNAAVGAEFGKPYFQALGDFLRTQRRTKQVFPAEEDVFAALRLTPYPAVKVVLLGQDPYHDDGQAHGLCFSVKPPTPPPPSLRNIFKELRDDLGCRIPEHGDLTEWARRGVLLLNTVLTVEAHVPGSHQGRGWETFTDAVIASLDARRAPVVFCLWGAHSRKKAALVDLSRHEVVEAAHPSPLSAKKFFGSRPFSRTNDALIRLGQAPIDWQLT
jgi:uracil-DNA glycosylase